MSEEDFVLSSPSLRLPSPPQQLDFQALVPPAPILTGDGRVISPNGRHQRSPKPLEREGFAVSRTSFRFTMSPDRRKKVEEFRAALHDPQHLDPDKLMSLATPSQLGMSSAPPAQPVMLWGRQIDMSTGLPVAAEAPPAEQPSEEASILDVDSDFESFEEEDEELAIATPFEAQAGVSEKELQEEEQRVATLFEPYPDEFGATAEASVTEGAQSPAKTASPQASRSPGQPRLYPHLSWWQTQLAHSDNGHAAAEHMTLDYEQGQEQEQEPSDGKALRVQDDIRTEVLKYRLHLLSLKSDADIAKQERKTRNRMRLLVKNYANSYIADGCSPRTAREKSSNLLRKLSEAGSSSHRSGRKETSRTMEGIGEEPEPSAPQPPTIQSLLLEGIQQLLSTPSTGPGGSGEYLPQGASMSNGQRRGSGVSHATSSTQSSVWLPDMSGSWIHRPTSPMGGSGVNRVPVSIIAATASGVTPNIPGKLRRPGHLLHDDSALVTSYEAMMKRSVSPPEETSTATLQQSSSSPSFQGSGSRGRAALPPVSPLRQSQRRHMQQSGRRRQRKASPTKHGAAARKGSATSLAGSWKAY